MYKNMDINEIDSLINKVNLIDVRTKEEYDSGHIDSAMNIEMTGLIYNADNFLNKSNTYYIYCEAGSRSSLVAHSLAQQGYDIINLERGYSGYKNNNR